jgi:hypothetical protein
LLVLNVSEVTQLSAVVTHSLVKYSSWPMEIYMKYIDAKKNLITNQLHIQHIPTWTRTYNIGSSVGGAPWTFINFNVILVVVGEWYGVDSTRVATLGPNTDTLQGLGHWVGVDFFSSALYATISGRTKLLGRILNADNSSKFMYVWCGIR